MFPNSKFKFLRSNVLDLQLESQILGLRVTYLHLLSHSEVPDRAYIPFFDL